MQKSLTQEIQPKLSKPLKSKKLKQKCVNAFNDYFYDYFIEQSQKASAQRQIYSQIIPLRNIALSIKKYPFPILSLEQAGSLQGIGEHFIGQFKKLINNYKKEIKEKNIDYVSLAYSIKPELGEPNLKRKRDRSQKNSDEENSKKLISFSNPGTKKASQLKEIKAEAKKLKFKNNLINIKLYTSVWTTAVCCYISFFEKESYDIEYSNIIDIGKKLKSKFKEYNIELEEPNINNEDKKDIEELKNLKLVDSIKKNKVTINDYLIKLVKIELEKIGFSVKKDNLNGILEYTKFEINKNNIMNYDIYDKEENDEIKNKLLEDYIDFMKYQTMENKSIINNSIDDIDIENNNYNNKSNINSSFSDNIYLIVDLREKGAGNENFCVEILNKLQSPIPIEEKNLSLGDFTWIYKDQLDGEEYMLDFIIERKTLNDLSASILDGRYNEQKYRLKNSPYKNIYYLFEGTELNTHNNSNISKDAINTAINNTINIHDIKFYRSLSTKDTVNKLIEIDSNIRKNFTFLKDINGKKITYKKYVEIFAKTKNSTVEEIFLRQLRCFEHCGKKCVEILSNCFQTQLSFYKIIQGLKKKNVNEKNMENIIACCYYLHENKKEINVENVMECFDNIEEIEKFKKNIFFSKLFRKLAIVEMLNYYCFFNEDKTDLEGDINFKDNKENNKLNINIINEDKKSGKKKNNSVKKKNKSYESDNYSDDINIDIDDISDESYDEGKKKKVKRKKGKSKDNKRKKKKNKINDKDKENYEEYGINNELDLDKNEDKKNKSTEEKNNISDISNNSKIKECFKHLEDIGNEQDFNNFEYQ